MSVASEMLRKLQGVDPKLSELLLSIAEEVDKQREAWEASMIQREFGALRQTVLDLTLAQKRTDERIDRLTERIDALAEAQRRTDERINALAEAQRRTDERIDRLTERIDALAEAQRRTDERIDRLTERIDALAEAQRRTDERLEALARAQENTERAMQQGFQKVFDKIATLGSRWGIQTEDVFRRTIEALLARQGLTVRRGYHGRREVDIVIHNGTHLLLEITSFLRLRDVDKLLASAQAYEEETGRRPQLMIAASYVPPSVMRHLLACGREFELISHEDDEE